MRIIKSFLMGIYALSIPLLVSAQQSVPYSQNFDTAAGFETFTVVDANNDGTKWAYEDSKFAAYCSHQMTGADDDWLFTPALNLKAGHTYELTFSVASVNNVSPQTSS